MRNPRRPISVSVLEHHTHHRRVVPPVMTGVRHTERLVQTPAPRAYPAIPPISHATAISQAIFRPTPTVTPEFKCDIWVCRVFVPIPSIPLTALGISLVAGGTLGGLGLLIPFGLLLLGWIALEILMCRYPPATSRNQDPDHHYQAMR